MNIEEELRTLPGVEADWNDDEVLAHIGVCLANEIVMRRRLEGLVGSAPNTAVLIDRIEEMLLQRRLPAADSPARVPA